jgi:LysM repeat protein
MKKRNSVIARILAALALIAAVVVVVMIVSAGLKEDSTEPKKSGANQPAKQQKPKQTKKKQTPKTYEVQSGDTLSSIAHKFGLTVAELQTLNPEVDAQTLIIGEVLKLRE